MIQNILTCLMLAATVTMVHADERPGCHLPEQVYRVGLVTSQMFFCLHSVLRFINYKLVLESLMFQHPIDVLGQYRCSWS